MSLDLETRARAESILSETDLVEGELEKVGSLSRKDIEEIAQEYANKPSTFLAAVVGAVVGATGGITLAGYVGVLAVVTGPAGMALGAALAVLGWRGRSMWRHERAADNYDTAMKRMNKAIGQLSPDLHPKEYAELLALRQELIKVYAETAYSAISSDDRQTVVEHMAQLRSGADQNKKGVIVSELDRDI